jgi:hypothetical protein
LAGTVTVLLVTRNGPYVSPDAVSYIGTARGLAAGDGFTAPPGTPLVGHFAPLFPVTLAGLDTLGVDPLDGARWLNALLLGATVLVVGFALRRSTEAWWPGLVGGVLVICAADVLSYYSSVLSDPLFALLAVLSLVLLAAYIEERRPFLLGAATTLAGLAFLTRYAGIALVAAGALALVANGASRRWRGLLEAAIFSVAAVLPAGLWIAWARGTHGRGSEGDVVLHLFHGRYLARGAANIFEWVIPDAVPWPLGAMGIVGAVTLLVWARREPDRRPRLPLICAIFVVTYLAVLLLDRLLLDASALLDKRFLFPLHLVAIVGLLALVRIRGGGRQALDRVTVVVVSALVLLQVGAGAAWVRDSIDDGGARRGGYSASQWRDSSVVADIGSLPPAVPVYTNGPDAIWFLTGRSTKMLPAEEDYLTGETNPRYGAQVAAMASRLRAEHGVIVYFPAIRSRHSLPTVADLRRVFPLQEVVSDPVGRIYAPSG